MLKKRKWVAGGGAHMGRRLEVERIDGWLVLVVGPATCRRYNLFLMEAQTALLDHERRKKQQRIVTFPCL